jgi:hypothetical protein
MMLAWWILRRICRENILSAIACSPHCDVQNRAVIANDPSAGQGNSELESFKYTFIFTFIYLIIFI